jgi:Putative DNA-binding domain
VAYKTPRTAQDINALQLQREPEGPYLEFKSAKLFSSKNEKIFETLSKELTAFANAAGGVLVIGVEEDDNHCFDRVEPISDSSKTVSWLEDGLLPRITPPLAMNVQEIAIDGGRIMVIEVVPSPSAPHQAGDFRYYARRQFRVDPLPGFEIDDIRRSTESLPISVSLGTWFESGLMNFFIKNAGLHPIYNVKVHFDRISGEEITADWNPSFERPYTEPFSIIHQDEKLSFLGASFHLFEQKNIDELKVFVSFVDHNGLLHQIEKMFFIKDYSSTQTQRTNAERSLEKIEDQLSKIGKALEDMVRISKNATESVVHSSGLNLSNTSLSALSGNSTWKWNGENLTFKGLAEVLELDMETAFKVWSGLFGATHFVNGSSVKLEQLDVAEEVKEKIRRRLIIKAGSLVG